MNFEEELKKLNRKYAIGIIDIDKYNAELLKIEYLKVTKKLKEKRKNDREN
jgi:hypothetical protein